MPKDFSQPSAAQIELSFLRTFPHALQLRARVVGAGGVVAGRAREEERMRLQQGCIRGRTDGRTDGAAVAYSIHAAAAAPSDGPTALGATAINRAASTCKFFPSLLWRALRVAFPNSNQQKFRITQ